MKNLIKLHDIYGNVLLINPHHIVGVTTYRLKSNAKANIILSTGEDDIQLAETPEQIEALVNGNPEVPRVGETYYYYDIIDDLKKASVFANEEPHISRVNVGNCFKTLEEVNFDFIKLQLGEGGR